MEVEQDLMVLYPPPTHVRSLPFVCEKFIQRISLIQEVRKWRNKEKSSRET